MQYRSMPFLCCEGKRAEAAVTCRVTIQPQAARIRCVDGAELLPRHPSSPSEVRILLPRWRCAGAGPESADRPSLLAYVLVSKLADHVPLYSNRSSVHAKARFSAGATTCSRAQTLAVSALLLSTAWSALSSSTTSIPMPAHALCWHASDHTINRVDELMPRTGADQLPARI